MTAKENKKAKVDCGSPWCIHSRKHRTPCHNCACEKVRHARPLSSPRNLSCLCQYYGPDASETVLGLRPGFCPECRPWYKNQNGAR